MTKINNKNIEAFFETLKSISSELFWKKVLDFDIENKTNIKKHPHPYKKTKTSEFIKY